MSSGPVIAAVRDYYEAAITAHGASPAGVDWKDQDSQHLRHRQFLRLVQDQPEASVLDLGCGYGDFLAYLRSHGHRGHYTGIDVAPAMIDSAKALHGDSDDRMFRIQGDQGFEADYAIASGIFNVIRGTDSAGWTRYVEETIGALARSSRLGFGFNMLSLNSDPERRRNDLYYADPSIMLSSVIARYGRHVALLQDYGLWEFTLLVRHRAGVALDAAPAAAAVA